MTLIAEDLAGATFESCRIADVRAGDVIRVDGGLWQVTSTLGIACSVVSLAAAVWRTFSGHTVGLEKRAGEPLPVEW